MFDDDGRFNPAYDEAECQPFFGDTIIIAIGQSTNLTGIKEQGIVISRPGGLEADLVTLQTPIDWVFAGGDAFYGPKSVVDAVACGKEAAESIHRFINGMDLAEGRQKVWEFVKPDDLSQEPKNVRDTYGRNTYGQSCLLARRLVEAGTRVVEVIWPKVANSDNHSWDHHSGLTKRMKDQSGPMLDTGLSALITDLDDRGLLDETLVVAIGEFGRTPKINDKGGRDHWAKLSTLAFAGGGLRMGQIIGQSARAADVPGTDPVTTADLMATVMHTLFDVGQLRLQQGL